MDRVNLELYKNKINELETTQAKLESNNRELRSMSNQP